MSITDHLTCEDCGMPTIEDEQCDQCYAREATEHMLGDCDDIEPCESCLADMHSLAEERRAR